MNFYSYGTNKFVCHYYATKKSDRSKKKGDDDDDDEEEEEFFYKVKDRKSLEMIVRASGFLSDLDDSDEDEEEDSTSVLDNFDNLCCACQDKKPSVTFECGHKCICSGCADQLVVKVSNTESNGKVACPLCRRLSIITRSYDDPPLNVEQRAMLCKERLKAKRYELDNLIKQKEMKLKASQKLQFNDMERTVRGGNTYSNIIEIKELKIERERVNELKNQASAVVKIYEGKRLEILRSEISKGYRAMGL